MGFIPPTSSEEYQKSNIGDEIKAQTNTNGKVEINKGGTIKEIRIDVLIQNE